MVKTILPHTHEGKIARWLPPGSGLLGVEIGPGVSPVPGLDPVPIYVDCFKAFGAEPTRADFFGHACSLPFHDHSLDYVIASHVLEHVDNPVAALAEWHRVLRPNGLIYLVVPDRRATWEHARGLTPVAHMLDDFTCGTTASDATHIDEFVFEADWSLFSPDTPPADVPEKQTSLARGMHEAVERGEDINIHFHTFEPSTLQELLETLASWPVRRFNWDILDFAPRFPADNPNGILAVLRVWKGWSLRPQINLLHQRIANDPRAILRADAQSFAEWAAQTLGLGGAR